MLFSSADAHFLEKHGGDQFEKLHLSKTLYIRTEPWVLVQFI